MDTTSEYIQKDEATRVRVLSEALPYIQQFAGRTIVVKYGGAAMKDSSLKETVLRDIVFLACVGLRPVVVHGGGHICCSCNGSGSFMYSSCRGSCNG